MSDLLALRAVRAKTGFSPSWIYRKVAEGKFPKPVKVGVATRWICSEVDEWVNAHIEASRNSEVPNE